MNFPEGYTNVITTTYTIDTDFVIPLFKQPDHVGPINWNFDHLTKSVLWDISIFETGKKHQLSN